MKGQKKSCRPAAMGRAQFGFSSPGEFGLLVALRNLPSQTVSNQPNCLESKDTSFGILEMQGGERKGL